MKKYTIELVVDEQWLQKWYDRPGIIIEKYPKQQLETWLEIQCAGTGASVESIEETQQ